MSEAQLLVLMQLNINVWVQYLPYLSAQMQLQIAQGVTSGLTTAQIVEGIGVATISTPQIETLVTTMLNDYSRTVTMGMMEDMPRAVSYTHLTLPTNREV